MILSKTTNTNQEEKSLQISGKSVPQQAPKQPLWLETIIERYPEQVGELLKVLPEMITGNPKKIEAETKIALRTLTGFFILMVMIVTLTAFLAYNKILGGDAVGFILGSAFGSITTFLYRYLIPAETR